MKHGIRYLADFAKEYTSLVYGSFVPKNKDGQGKGNPLHREVFAEQVQHPSHLVAIAGGEVEPCERRFHRGSMSLAWGHRS